MFRHFIFAIASALLFAIAAPAAEGTQTGLSVLPSNAEGTQTGLSVLPSNAEGTQTGLSVLHNDADFDTLVLVQRRPLNPSHVYTYHVEGLSSGGGLFSYSLKNKKLTKLVDATDGLVLDCQVSYAGDSILFSWKRTMKDPFEIWRVNIDGTGLTKVVADTANNMNACWLPDGGIAFTSDRKPAFAYCWTSTSPVLYRASADGSNILRLSANYLSDFTPSVTSDGRILYSRWEYVDRPAIPIQSLWSINADGTSLSGVFGNRVLSPATFMEANEIPGRSNQLLCVMTSHGGPCRGAIGLVDTSNDANAQSSFRNLTPDVRVPPADDGLGGDSIRGPYESPFPLDSRRYLVSRAGEIQIRQYDDLAAVEVVLTRPDDASRKRSPLGFYSARPVRARKLPQNPHPLQLPGADATPWADIIVNDVNFGLGDAVKPGEIKMLAVVQEMEKDVRSDTSRRQFGFQFPVVSCGATYAPKRVWGFAKIEADGSTRFKAPANVPIYFLPLDAEGRAVQRMRTFTHFMPGERQNCVGCHENRNYVTPHIRRGRSIAASLPPQELVPPSWGDASGFSFPRVVQPVLDKHCVSCHSQPDVPAGAGKIAGAKLPSPAGGLDLSGDRTDYFSVAYENLARRGTQAEHGNDVRGGMDKFGKNPYTSWIPTYNGLESNILQIAPKTWGSPVSKLADVIISGHPRTDGSRRVQLSADERLRVLMWIDLNVPFYGTSQSLQPDLRGCRKILPANLDSTLRDIAKKRGIKFPRTFFVRLDNPQKNIFLQEPLVQGQFTGTDDPDYQRILACFQNVPTDLEKRVDVDFRKVTQAAAGCPLLPEPKGGATCR